MDGPFTYEFVRRKVFEIVAEDLALDCVPEWTLSMLMLSQLTDEFGAVISNVDESDLTMQKFQIEKFFGIDLVRLNPLQDARSHKLAQLTLGVLIDMTCNALGSRFKI